MSWNPGHPAWAGWALSSLAWARTPCPWQRGEQDGLQGPSQPKPLQDSVLVHPSAPRAVPGLGQIPQVTRDPGTPALLCRQHLGEETLRNYTNLACCGDLCRISAEGAMSVGDLLGPLIMV